MNTLVIIAIVSLIAIGFYCLIITRNILKIIVALQVLVKGAMIAMILAGKLTDQMELAQSMAITIIVADTIVAVIGLAMSIQLREKTGTCDIHSISKLKR
ncbi:MAG TPA: NADH-quinone oxidoreductase subunit K [Flexilinea sp.]|jgi:NADH:ubiquinone oxidoreductase subunit K|nr:NADH-quinone oxidoreductase subunit K [Flexilinea sp.]OQA26036.1 MAG: NADH-quinone oxidoreductase subunit K [Chloroflexi bacterium ADurb.Bin344]HNY19035.1 NADH-quinone oxidoreductase subunit K [Flexilinea sp.]HNY93927.1 NADH-quinone oxidoreductase subunit K [Flexilinea sp.]HOG20976.1 NADH-quinone oxidoreductase subunit K [Flexilinea sp.]